MAPSVVTVGGAWSAGCDRWMPVAERAAAAVFGDGGGGGGHALA
ncbi:hypothetical protein ACP70R_006778 [Stipagrostis hirtigluma subsp. patula]